MEKTTRLTGKKLHELAWTMFGRGYGACNADEKRLLTQSIDGKVTLPAKDVLCERGHDGAWVCSAIVGGVRVHRVYYDYTKAYAKRHFKDNPPK